MQDITPRRWAAYGITTRRWANRRRPSRWRSARKLRFKPNGNENVVHNGFSDVMISHLPLKISLCMGGRFPIERLIAIRTYEHPYTGNLLEEIHNYRFRGPANLLVGIF